MLFSSSRDLLLDEGKGMYERYAALFALRNDGGDEAISAIVDSLGAKSALLRHEVNSILWQYFVFNISFLILFAFIGWQHTSANSPNQNFLVHKCANSVSIPLGINCMLNSLLVLK